MIGPLCEAWMITNWKMICTHGSCQEIVNQQDIRYDETHLPQTFVYVGRG